MLKLIAAQLQSQGRQVALMAPTGRAAKILRDKTGMDASTIHSRIYNYTDLKEIKIADEEMADSFKYYFDLNPVDSINNQVFIIDESSMISDDFSEGEFFRFGSGKLLSDLIEYTRIQHPHSGNKLIFVGDPAQLAPPTGSNKSPALSAEYLSEKFDLKTNSITLFDVVRQADNSGILAASQNIRKRIDSGFFNHFEISENPRDIHYVGKNSFFSMYDNAPGRKIIVAYTNQTAYQINLDLRRHKYGGDYVIKEGDVMLVGQNNHKIGLFNGEFGVINRCSPSFISRELVFKVVGGATAHILLKWIKIELAYQDEQGFKATNEVYMLENYLHGKTPTLRPEEQQALYVDFKNRNKHLRPGTAEFKESLRNDPFFNALRLRYGFAVTCHKAQGGEWDNAFVFWDYGRPPTFNIWSDSQEKTGRNNADFYRWAYTAITRASKSLYCINPPAFTPYGKIAFVTQDAITGIQHLSGEPSTMTFFVPQPEMVDKMDRMGIPTEPTALQNHFLSVAHQCQLNQIEVCAYTLKGYEFTYSFRQGDKTAAVKGWINGKNNFSPTYQKNPSGTNSEELFASTLRICQEHSKFQPQASKPEPSPVSPTAMDWSIAEQKPFLFQLFSDVKDILDKHQITITGVSHLQYKERYTIERNGEKTDIDIEYDGNGFFGRIYPLPKKSVSPLLLHNIESAFLTLKNR